MTDPQLLDSILKSYKQKKKKEKFWILVTQVMILICFFGVWEVAGRLKWIDNLLFSYPSNIVTSLWNQLLEGSLLFHTGFTVAETIIGFILGTLCGTALATLIWWSPFLSKVLDPYIVVLNSMPKVALGPLFIVGIGPNMFSIIAMTLAVTVIITTLVIYTSFKEVDPNYIKVISIFGGDKKKVYLKVILPASIPTMVSALKVNVGLAWIGVIVGEFLVSKQGLGYLIIYGFQVFNFTLVIGSLFVIAIVASLMYQAVSYLEKKVSEKR